VKQVAVYGKGGIGKSTITANLSAAMAAGGTRVLQIGCDPKHDSTKLLLGGTSQATVLQLLRERGDDLRREDVVLPGFGGVDCVEAGGPEPGVGCAGRGILSMAKALDAVGLDKGGYDVVAYDVLGDVVCGGFSVPMRAEYADEVLIVSSGEIMSLYAANNIARGLLRFGGKLGGIVGNARDVPHEEALLCALAAALGTELVAMVPRDPLFREAELARRTVVEHAPDSERAAQFRALAERVAGPARTVVPTPLDEDDFERLIFRVAGGEDPDVREAPGTFRTPATDARPPAVEPDFGAYLDAPDVPVSKAVRERAPRFSCALQGAFAVLAHVGAA
jgi:nitrogenase iron protein NifH